MLLHAVNLYKFAVLNIGVDAATVYAKDAI
jgi:hypothetical protein